MKIVVVGWGTTGDVYPVVALAERLLERGHQVQVCALALYRDRVLEIGAEFYGDWKSSLTWESFTLRWMPLFPNAIRLR